MPEPNAAQRDLIEGIEGCYLVDAGPGTGKTFTITRRYVRILEEPDVSPEDVLLLTFTRHAATEMRDRIVDRSAHPPRELADAPIGTFHALCHEILREGGHDAPAHLGIDDVVTDATALLEDEATEQRRFRRFIGRFGDRHPEHESILATVRDPGSVLDLLRSLAAKGVLPTADGWYRNSAAHLHGDSAAFAELFDDRNQQPPESNAQSPLRADLTEYGTDCSYRSAAPARSEIRGDGTKTVPTHVRDLVFEEDRADLIAFVHDVYHEYLAFALARNYLNFGFMQALAYAHLCEDDGHRARLGYEYVMIDEFQDTSEIQFKIALLLANTTNLCVVGDWKQSIYSFQYAAVENITRFSDRLARYASDLNRDRRRVSDPFGDIREIELRRNYRSTQAIVDRAEHALTVPGSGSETVDAAAVRETLVSLEAETDAAHSRIEGIRHEQEHAAVLTKIGEIVGNDDYAVREEGTLRRPTYGDIAVVTRTRGFGRELLALGRSHDYPMAYEGDVELFRSDPAKFVLAWLRILVGGADADRGWGTILERAGYTPAEIATMLEEDAIPRPFHTVRNELDDLERVGAIVDAVCRRYGCTGPTADGVRLAVQSAYESTGMTRADLVRYVEQGIETGATREVHGAAGRNAVKVRTIHATKGLEYPIVLLANVNRQQFPSTGGSSGTIVFEDGIGLRCRRILAADHGDPHIYANWRWGVLKHCRDKSHDEERRLLYVAMTRARDHVIFSAGERPSAFLESFPVEVERYPPDIPDPVHTAPTASGLDVTIPDPDGPRRISPHDLMDTSVLSSVEHGRGPRFGTELHTFAERYAEDEDVAPTTADARRVAAYLDGLSGEVLVERDAYLPLTVDGVDVSVHGYVDLVHVTPDAVELVDYKTDVSDAAAAEYQLQLSIYYHVLDATFPDRPVTASILYTYDDRLARVDPVSLATLRDLVADRIETR